MTDSRNDVWRTVSHTYGHVSSHLWCININKNLINEHKQSQRTKSSLTSAKEATGLFAKLRLRLEVKPKPNVAIDESLNNLWFMFAKLLKQNPKLTHVG